MKKNHLITVQIFLLGFLLSLMGCGNPDSIENAESIEDIKGTEIIENSGNIESLAPSEPIKPTEAIIPNEKDKKVESKKAPASTEQREHAVEAAKQTTTPKPLTPFEEAILLISNPFSSFMEIQNNKENSQETVETEITYKSDNNTFTLASTITTQQDRIKKKV